MSLFDRLRGRPAPQPPSESPLVQPLPSLPYSWVISGTLAIGPMPRTQAHWQQLESAGFRSRFSCCYPEEALCPPPEYWMQAQVSLPDHRRQEILLPERLDQALHQAEALITSQPATYLHCMAGLERSPLVATGILARQRGIHVLEALELVRLCHPRAMPIYSDLDVLEMVIKG